METTKSKKRAFRACMPCRARKVRCIVTETCQPCMNCKLDEKDCDFARGPRILPQYPPPCRPSLNTTDAQSEASGSDLAPSSIQGRSPGAAEDVGGNGLKRRCAGDDGQGQCKKASTSNQISKEMAGLLYDPTDPAYSFLQAPKTKTVLPQDLEFLYGQGCFIVPERHVLDEFMKQYFCFIHPILPIINEADFWAMYNSKDSDTNNDDRISIIVLQGMLFTSATFVSQEIRQSLGFKTTQDAKYSFYRRAKLLYDFGYERSSIAVAQAAVLLSHSHLIPLPYGGFKQLGSLWAGIAIHHARDARAHRYYMMTPSNPPSPKDLKRYNTLKRLWWCCIISDRVIPLTSRQNIKIARTNFNFDGSPPLSIEDLADEYDCSEVYDSTTKRLLAQVSIKIAELCIVLTDVLTLSALVHENPSWGISSRLAETNQAGICRIRLQRWYQTFLSMKAAMGKMPMDEGEKSARSSVVLFTNLAEMYYHSARLTLCHYEMLHLGQAALSLNPLFDTTDMTQKTYELQNATSQVTECLAELTRLGLIRWLPMSAVGCTAFPLALQILDAELFQQKLRSLSPSKSSPLFSDYQRERLNVLVDAMKIYRPRYCMADWITQTVKYIVNATHNWLPSKPFESGNSRISVASWIEILQQQPTYYLRLALTMDLSISNGKLPDDDDFPPGLRQAWHGRITATVSPEFLPINFENFLGAGTPAQNTNAMSERLLPSSDEPVANAATYREDEPASEIPIEQIILPGETTNKTNTFDTVFQSIAEAPDILTTQPITGNDEAFYNTFNPSSFGEDIFSLNPESSFSAFPSQTFDFSMGGSYSIHNSINPLGKNQWTNGQSDTNADEEQQRINDSFLDTLRDATSKSFRTNGERLLEELSKVINLP